MSEFTATNLDIAAEPVPDYLTWSVLTLIFVSWPLGIVSTLRASAARRKAREGDYIGARHDAKIAKIVNLVALAFLAGLIVIVLIGLVTMAGSTTSP